MINSLYKDYAQLNIKYEVVIKQRDIYKHEIENYKKETTKHSYNCNCNCNCDSK